ncbi:MAG: FkbM family methyltransferase [Gemmataceae bacterium]
MSIAREIAERLGTNSVLVRLLQPLREWTLAAVYDHRGLVRKVNGASMRVLPRYRWYFAPDYDPPVARFFQQRVRPGDVCINVGANLGVYALQFAHWSAPSGQVFAFEPNPATAGSLRAHVAMNRLGDRVHVMERAVSERPGMATFHAAGVNGMSRLGEPNPALAGQTTCLTVEVDSLDEFCGGRGLMPRAMMIDVEGFEAAVLTGARSLFADRGRLPATVVEMHPNAWAVAGSDRASFERLLAELGVRPVPLSGQTDPLGEYGHVYLEPTDG